MAGGQIILPNSSPERENKRVHVALPIRLTYWDSKHKPVLELGCTYDISARGARVTGSRGVRHVGDIIAIERGRNKVFCRVVWVGEPNSEFHGQMGLESVETERTMWDAELRDMEELYDPLKVEVGIFRNGPIGARNRRRLQRFTVDGTAELMRNGLAAPSQAGVRDISELGCLIATPQILLPGVDVKLAISVSSYDLSLKGKVRHAEDLRTGIEFREIRKGDRQTLNYLLRKLAENQLEQSFELEPQE